MPQKADPQTRPDASDQLAHGKYLVGIAGCAECHTPFEKGKSLVEFSLSGNREFGLPDGSVVRSANITPDPMTGIGKWTMDQFVSRFKNFSDSAFVLPAVKAGEFNTIMPWTMYGNMKEDDLKAIFTYLKSVQPISRKVETFSKAGR